MSNFKGKAIYQPKGKAGEYSKWACNFYVGCSNGCTYCYCKKGILKGVMGMDFPQLKKCFKDEDHAFDVFEKELKANLPELQNHGLFFSFTTDPMLEVTYILTCQSIDICLEHRVPVKILTKCTKLIDLIIKWYGNREDTSEIAFGFTLTGHDELEPNASTNAERIEAMKKLHDAGFKTFARIEPIVDLDSSMKMIHETLGFCDLYKIGLESGKKYPKDLLLGFYVKMSLMLSNRSKAKVYWKDSVLNYLGIDREICNETYYATVDRDYNLFKKGAENVN